MTDKQINRWLRRQFSTVGWSLAGYHVLLNVMVIVSIAVQTIRQLLSSAGSGFHPDRLDMDAIAGNAWCYIVAVILSLVILFAAKGGGYWREVTVKEKLMGAGVWFALLFLCMGAQMVNTLWVAGLELFFNQFDKSLETLLEGVSGSSDTVSMFLYASLLAPIGEELIFRGYVLNTLRPYGKRFAVLGSAFLFGVFHGNLLQTPYAFLMGLILGYVTVEYSLIWSVALHMFNNLVLAELLTRLLEPLAVPVADGVMLILLGGSRVVSNILLFVKRREIVNHIQGEWMDRRVLKCFFTSGGILVLTVLMLLNGLAYLP